MLCLIIVSQFITLTQPPNIETLHSSDVRGQTDSHSSVSLSLPQAVISHVTATPGGPLSAGERGDDSVSPSFPSQRTSDIMGIPIMPGQDDPKADIRQQ